MRICLNLCIKHHYEVDVPDNISIDELKHLNGEWVNDMEFFGEADSWPNPPKVTYIKDMDTGTILYYE